MIDALSFLVLPFSAAVAFVLLHAYLGIHVLRRNIVFADLALAQLSALGATVAYANSYAPSSPAGFAYALLFTTVGAALLTITRGLSRYISREAFVGILYVGATAATILVIDRAPQGAEQVKRILLGSILTVSPAEVAKLVLLYVPIGIFHWFARTPLLAVSNAKQPTGRSGLSVSLWDFSFFLSFGVVVASSVTTAGVLLVFSFLIVPAVIGSIFSEGMIVVLMLAWTAGIVASAAGLAGSFALDVPTGAAMVLALVVFLVLAGVAKALIFTEPEQRNSNLRFAAHAVLVLALVAALASSLWLLVNPTADQPLAATFESASGLGAANFLSRGDREIFEGAARDAVRFQG
ncbi:MAG: metal ABC transporter permease [Burkholderiaceae bacterium]